MFVMNDNVII